MTRPWIEEHTESLRRETEAKGNRRARLVAKLRAPFVFDDWIKGKGFGATQLMFLRTVYFAAQKGVKVSKMNDLLKVPFSNIADPRSLFDQSQISDIFRISTYVADDKLPDRVRVPRDLPKKISKPHCRFENKDNHPPVLCTEIID
jgi:hypothetical protein